MTQEDKELLLKDLCARVPYGVKLYIKDVEKGENIVFIGVSFRSDLIETWSNEYSIEECKPYLRPMSSMTDEEAREYANCGNVIAFSSQKDYLIPNPNSTDWLNAHHFDYRGLIEKGLAIEAPRGIYK